MQLEFRYALPDEYPQIAQFIDAHWARNHVYCRNEDLYHWTFSRPGHWDPQGSSVAVALADGELAGILGGIPFTFNRFGDTGKGIWLANYIIREDARRGPAALRLLSMLRGEPFTATMAFGINPATASIYRVLKGQVLPMIPRHFAVLPKAADRMVRLLAIAHPDWPESEARDLAARYTIEPGAGSAAYGCSIPERWDSSDWKVIATQTAGAARDADYLRWRYVDHPVFRYQLITLAEGERTGLLVWRLETIHQSVDGGRQPVDRIGRLVEFLPCSPDNAAALLGCFWKQLQSADAFGADYYGYHGPSRRLLNEAGFRQASEADADRIPSRFQPLDGKGGGIHSAGFWPQNTAACTLDEDCPWYWTKSDSDQDRPN
jgi:hypothetical protein